MKKQQEDKKKDAPEKEKKEKELRLKKEFINTTPDGQKKGK